MARCNERGGVASATAAKLQHWLPPCPFGNEWQPAREPRIACHASITRHVARAGRAGAEFLGGLAAGVGVVIGKRLRFTVTHGGQA